jgi:hypothetical protein
MRLADFFEEHRGCEERGLETGIENWHVWVTCDG